MSFIRHVAKSMALSVACLFCLAVEGQASSATPTAAFYDLMQTTPILTYQCYHNGSSIDPENSINFTILWDGTKKDTPVVDGTLWYAEIGTEDQYTKKSLRTHYKKQQDVGILTTGSTRETVKILEPPLNEMGYFMKIVVTSKNNALAYKIYDLNRNCTNADAILEKYCPDGCGMTRTR